MKALNKSTYITNAASEPTIAVVGDAKQKDFYSQVKIEKWNNEANFSIRYADKVLSHKVTEDGQIIASHPAAKSRIYELHAPKKIPVNQIRRVANNLSWQGIEATSEYEMFNQVGEPGTMLLAHYVVEEPTISVFDLMPAGLHLEVDEKGFAKDFNYADKSTYHPADIPMPKHDKVRLVRYYTPYTPVVNPYYMDKGIHNIDIQWHGSKCEGVSDALMTAIENIVSKHGVKTRRHKTRAKLYFKHKNRWVKFYSGQGEDGGLYAYINIASSYNKAYDFYRPDVEKDIRDKFAYGLQFGHSKINHEIVNEIMQEFAKLLYLPLVDKPYNATETTLWLRTQELQNDLRWLKDGVRNDANWFRQTKKDGVEFEVIFDQKPISNQVPFTTNLPKSVVAYVQAPLTFVDQISEGKRQPADVGGSLAIYHRDKKHNEYKTGKVAHIYRPIAHDADGWRVFCDFKEIKGKKDGEIYDLSRGLTVEVPNEFLEKAKYPVVIDPTLGYSASGAANSSVYNVILGTIVTPSQTGWLHSISALVDTSDATTVELEYALYTGQAPFYFQTQSSNNTTIGGNFRPLLLEKRPWHLTSGRNYLLVVTGTSSGASYEAVYPVVYHDSNAGKTSWNLARTYSANNWPNSLFGATSSTPLELSIYGHIGYVFPVMVGNNSATILAGNDRGIALTAKNDLAWSGAASNDMLMTGAYSIGDFRFDATTAAGVGYTRILETFVNGVNSTVDVSLPNPATSGSDTTAANIYAENTRIYLNHRATGGASPAASTPNRWRLQIISDSQPIMSRITTATAATRYAGIQDFSAGTTVASVEQVMPESGTLKTFRARMDSTLTAGSFTVTLVKNGVDTAVVMVLDSANQEVAASATSVSVTTGDRFYWKAVPSTPTAPSNARPIAVSCLYDSGTAGNGILLSSNSANVSTAANSFNNWYGNGAWNATEANVQALAEDVEFTKLYVLLSAAPTVGRTRTVALRQNGVTTDASVTVADTATNGTWTGKININKDDLINTIHTSTGTPSASSVKYGLVYNYGKLWIPQSTFF